MTFLHKKKKLWLKKRKQDFLEYFGQHFDIELDVIFRKYGKELISEKRFDEKGNVTFEKKETIYGQMDESIVNSELSS